MKPRFTNIKKPTLLFLYWLGKPLKKNTVALGWILFLVLPAGAGAQVVGNWTFDNTLVGTPGSNNTVSSASLGTSITTGAFNGGTVYYGEAGWPAGSIDPNAYLEFSLTPNSGSTLSLSTMQMNIRRSTTGTAAGSGPNNWSLRSSLDGFTTDIATGVLTLVSTTTVTVSLSSGFLNLSSPVTFRLYGYNATVSTGGLNRFVYDNITVNGITLLAIPVQDFKAIAINGNSVELSWLLGENESYSSIQVERSENGSDFSPIKEISLLQNTPQETYTMIDNPPVSEGTVLYYRIRITETSGQINYSAVHTIKIAGSTAFMMSPLPVGHGGMVRFNVTTDQAANYLFSIYNINGARITRKMISLSTGTSLQAMDNGSLPTGIYILTAEKSGYFLSTKILVQ
jgi:hypothetical protein